jgi:hypothetical protein
MNRQAAAPEGAIGSIGARRAKPSGAGPALEPAQAYRGMLLMGSWDSLTRMGNYPVYVNMMGVANATNEPEEHDDAEVTPEMVNAGRDVLEGIWLDFTGPWGFRLWDKVLPAVYLAMRAARSR